MKHIRKAEESVARQEELIVMCSDDRHCEQTAQEILTSLEEWLRQLKSRRDDIAAQLAPSSTS